MTADSKIWSFSGWDTKNDLIYMILNFLDTLYYDPEQNVSNKLRRSRDSSNQCATPNLIMGPQVQVWKFSNRLWPYCTCPYLCFKWSFRYLRRYWARGLPIIKFWFIERVASPSCSLKGEGERERRNIVETERYWWSLIYYRDFSGVVYGRFYSTTDPSCPAALENLLEGP